MRANTLVSLASGAVVAGVIRSTLRCALCQHPQFGSRYSVCPDCFAFNADWLTNPLGARALRCAEFDPFPSRALNLADAYRAAKAANRPDIALRIAEYVRGRKHLIQSRYAPTPEQRERDYRAWSRFMQRFVVSTAREDLFYAIFGDQSDSSYAGFSLAERFDIDGEAAVRAFEHPAEMCAERDECDEALDVAESVVDDLLARPRPLNRAAHERRIAEWLAKNRLDASPSSLYVRSGRKHRTFVGLRFRCGTYSYGMQRTGAQPNRRVRVWRAPEPAVAIAA